MDPQIPSGRSWLRLGSQHYILLAGLVSLMVGAGLILFTTGLIDAPGALVGTGLAVMGILLCLFSAWGPRRYALIFLGFFALQLGSLVILARAIWPSSGLLQLWPFLMIFAGLSFVPSGLIKKSRVVASYLIPAVSLIFLGSFFLLFSLGAVKLSFREFVFRLWPFLFIAAGIVLLGLYIGNRLRFSKKGGR